ncbi:uncharacterized protein ACNS7B_018451 [Menidia menidia]
MHFLTLILGILLQLFSSGETLQCFECLTLPCSTTVTCPVQNAQCASVRMRTYASGTTPEDIEFKSCALPQECGVTSLNHGVSRVVAAARCCSTDRCNNHSAPAIPSPAPNGKRCYTCVGTTCTQFLNCVGNEDHCVEVTVTDGGMESTLKGCASESFCSALPTAQRAFLPGPTSRAGISCCQGELCNSASSSSAGLLLMMVPLMSLVFVS